jgi:flagellar motor switch protein FliN
MSHYAEFWVRVAAELFHQALAGEPELIESKSGNTGADPGNPRCWFGSSITLVGDEVGTLSVLLDNSILDAPLLGEGVEQKASWAELLRETFEAACGELLAKTGKKCHVDKVEELAEAVDVESSFSRTFQLRSAEHSWGVLLRSQLSAAEPEAMEPETSEPALAAIEPTRTAPSAGLELLLDVELEASLRFGCREMPLGEILELGPGDVVQLDRHVADPVDLIVGDKIVARGEVVLVNGNFGLRISEVAAPKKRLESIRCLF